jgi:ketosteroid isomerase-like protein
MRTPLALLLLVAGLYACTQPKEPAAEQAPPAPIEIADDTYVAACQAGLAGMTNGDIDAFVKDLAENCVYRWNYGDSLVGKPAIAAYWKDRRTNVIDKITFDNEIWLPVKVNASEQVRPGNWVLSWYRVQSTYKTGKSMSQYIHTVYHFNDQGQVDEVIQYLDRVLIAQALTP